jgi:hypothetical protein
MTELYDQLVRTPNPPEEDFDAFLVGSRITAARQLLFKKISKLEARADPSQVIVVIGENGNGKTLLNNIVKEHLSKKNEIRDPTTNKVSSRFAYFFSHIHGHVTSDTTIGLELFRNLQFHFKRSPIESYALVSLKLFEEFLAGYTLPLWVKLLHPIKWATSAGVKALGLESFLSDVLGDAAGETMDTVFERMQRYLAGQDSAKKFEAYCSQRRVGGFLAKLYGQRHRTLSANELNKELFDDLTSARILDSSRYAVAEICDIISAVHAQVLVILIDDCNDDRLIMNIVGFIDGLVALDREADPVRPRVLMVLNMLKDKYDQIIDSHQIDKSVKHRIAHNAPIELPRPTAAETRSLVDRLVSLRNARGGGRIINREPAWERPLVQECRGKSYREAIHIIDSKLDELAQ